MRYSRERGQYLQFTTALVFLMLFCMASSEFSSLSQFYKRRECSGDACGHRVKIPDSRGSLTCARHCQRDAMCIGFSVDRFQSQDVGGTADDECYVHRACQMSQCSSDGGNQREWMYEYLPFSARPHLLPRSVAGTESVATTTEGTVSSTESADQTATASLQPCQNNGVRKNGEQKCTCIDGWVGMLCESRPKSCADLKHDRYANGYHRVMLHPHTSALPFSALCRLQDFDIITFILKTDGDEEFNKPWADYENGFYIMTNKRTWLGLRNIHALCKSGHNKVTLKVVINQKRCEIQTFDFHIGNSSTKYALSVGFSEKTSWNNDLHGDMLLDCLALSNRKPFATYDSESCPCPVGTNCASRAGAGWWHSGCDLPCNPLGAWYKNWPRDLAEDKVRLPGLNLHNSSYAEGLEKVELYFIYSLP